MVFVAGQKVRAAELNAGIPTFARVASDVTVNNTTTLVNATGLSLAVEASAVYALDGWIYYESNPTADIKFAWTGPASATFVVGIYGPPAGTAPVVNQERINYTDQGTFDTLGGGLSSAAGDDEFTGSVWPSIRPSGVAVIGATAGTIQLQFAQNTANASNTRIKANSWLRLARIA